MCATAHSGPLVAELLGGVRDAVDEVIVAADARVCDDDLGHYAEVADVLLRYEHCGANRHWPWLAEQAKGDWLLLLDGDELASSALVAALPDLVADRRIRQYSLPIHWLWPDARSRLLGEPWGSDRRLRLVRNDGRLMFGARQHVLAEEDRPIRFFDELSVYHLDLLLPDRARREAKVARYDTEQFGLLTREGTPFNRAFYLPEDTDGARETLALPAADAERVTRALDAPHEASRARDRGSVELHEKAEVAWHAPRAALPPDAYRATLELAGPLPAFTAERPDHPVWLRVTNDGTARWPGGESREPLVRVGMAWQPVDGGARQEVGRALLPHVLDPGETALLPVEVSAPPQAGPAELVLDLVHEHVRWFDCPLRARVEIGPSATQRLAARMTRGGTLVPPAAAMEERRRIGGRNGLLRRPAPVGRPADPHIAELTSDMPIGTWALDAATIDRLVELVRDQRPRAIVEFGSGTSTVVFAALLAEQQGEALGVISFEQDAGWAARTREALRQRGLEGAAVVSQLPLGNPGNGAPPGYLLTKEAAKLLRRHPPELVLVDGPTLESGASRLGAADLVAPFVRRDVTLLLDDALRDAELCVAEAWERRVDITVHGIRTTPKGLLEATLRAPASPHGVRRRILERVRSQPASTPGQEGRETLAPTSPRGAAASGSLQRSRRSAQMR